MISDVWADIPLGREHDRQNFDCGDEKLNTWIRQFARQSHVAGGAKTFVAVRPPRSNEILGFYSISPASTDYQRTPAVLRRGLGQYDVPVFRLGRLGVGTEWQGRGLGSKLVLAAGKRCLRVSEEVGGVALLIDAKNDTVARWYERLGAVRLDDTELTLFLPLATIAAAIES